MLYMPQYHNGETWNDMWFSPCDYTRAKSIKNMLLRENTPRNCIRILAVV